MSSRMGIITDIHNNATALKAVISRLTQMGCDKVVCCGDIIGIGPCPDKSEQEMTGRDLSRMIE